MPFIQLKVQDLAHSWRMWWTCSYGFAIPHTAPPEGLKQRFGTAILVTLCTSEACAHRNIQNNNLNFRGLVFSVLLNSVNSYQCCCYQQPLDKEWQSCQQQPFDTLNPQAVDMQKLECGLDADSKEPLSETCCWQQIWRLILDPYIFRPEWSFSSRICKENASNQLQPSMKCFLKALGRKMVQISSCFKWSVS